MKIAKTHLYLLLIFILALVLRILAALYVDVGTDEMIYSIIPRNIISAGRIGTVEQSPLYFYWTDAGYKLFGGLSPITARLPSILFGSLAVFVVYLFCLELFPEKKIGLISAFLFAISGYSLQYNPEMDMMAFFLALLSMLFLVKALRQQWNWLYLSSGTLALAILVKNIVALFIPAYLIIFGYYCWRMKRPFAIENKKITMDKNALRTIGLSIALFLVIIIPIFAYNYLIYTEKGIGDYYFSTMLGIGQNVHQGLEGKVWAFGRLKTVIADIFWKLLRWDTVLLLLGIIGIGKAIRGRGTREYGTDLVALSTLFLVLYLAGKTGSASHYLWIPLTLSIFAGYGVHYLQQRFHPHFASRITFSRIIGIIIILALVINFFYFQGLLQRSKNASTIPLWKFVHEYVPEDAIIVIDPRIYRGIHAWVFNDRHYLEGTYFPQLLQQLDTVPGEKTSTPLYYVECGPGSYCGWKPEDFERIKSTGEELSQMLKPVLTQITQIKTEHNFILYQGALKVPLGVTEAIDRTHVFWFYPVGWTDPKQAVDYYELNGRTIAVHSIGRFFLFVDMLLVIGIILMMVWLTLKSSSLPEHST